MNKEERKKYAQLDKQIATIGNQMNVIVATHRKAIWMDKTYDKDRKDVLRNAELTLRLADDEKYQNLLHEFWDLEAQAKELRDIFEL